MRTILWVAASLVLVGCSSPTGPTVPVPTSPHVYILQDALSPDDIKPLDTTPWVPAPREPEIEPLDTQPWVLDGQPALSRASAR